jgi:hypothetical protein
VGVAVVVASAVTLLATGGTEQSASFEDPRGDAVYPDGSLATSAHVTDVVFSEVRPYGGGIEFEARMDTSIPRVLHHQELTWRWEILEQGAVTWALVATLEAGPTATIFHPESDFGASTFDGSFPGSMVGRGHKLLVRLRVDELEEDFPPAFRWSLEASLRIGEGEDAPRASDRVPSEGYGDHGG